MIVRQRIVAMVVIARSLLLCLIVAAFVGLAGPVLAQDGSGVAASGPVKAANDTPVGSDDVYANIPAKDEYGRDQLAMFRDWNPDPLGSHAANLELINPSLADVIRTAQADNPRLHFVIGSGRRDAGLQRKAVAWGWSKTRDSLHLSGDAVDLWPLDAEGRVLFDPAAQDRIARAMDKAAAKLGISIRWGGYFRGFKDKDRSHFEIARLRPKQLAASSRPYAQRP